MHFIILLLAAIRFLNIDTCPIYCQCYSAFDGYHITCQNADLYEISLNLTTYVQTTQHQNLIIDLSSNYLSILPCSFLQIQSINTLILTKNRLESIPNCFSQSSIQILHLNENRIRFNQTNLLSSSKLLYLDLSHNYLSDLPPKFFNHLRRLRTLILNGELNLFELTNHEWIRSLTTRNQLTIVICDEKFHLPLCLFNQLFQSNRLFSLELNSNIHCDCSFVYLPLEKIHFHHCQIQHEQQLGICNSQTSLFESGHSLIYLKNNKYRQICSKEYQYCQNIQINKYYHQLTTLNFIESNQSESSSLLVHKSMTNTTTISLITSSNKENITAGAIIPFIIVLLIVTIVCLYVILSGHFIKMNKNPIQMKNFIMRQKKQQNMSNVSTGVNANKNSARFDDCISIENINMNSNPKKTSFQSYHQRKRSYSDNESELTFYSMNNDLTSSTSFVQSSSTMTEFDIASLSSTINSSETVIISNRNQHRIY